MSYKIIILLCVLCSVNSFPQGVDISGYLQKIEAGKRDSIKEILPKLKSKNSDDANVLFLEGVLTENGQESVSIFSKVIDKYPNSKYADASLFRIYSYYYALGLYDAATPFLERLKKDYPSSPYIRVSEKDTPVIDVKKLNRPAVDPLPPGKKINYKFTIQAGAFGNRENAESLKKQFEDAGYTSEIIEKTVGGTVFQVVYVGKFVTEKETKDFLTRLNNEFSLDGRIVKIN
jgi:tetratricopeptide (TPR) repeat protein